MFFVMCDLTFLPLAIAYCSAYNAPVWSGLVSNTGQRCLYCLLSRRPLLCQRRLVRARFNRPHYGGTQSRHRRLLQAMRERHLSSLQAILHVEIAASNVCLTMSDTLPRYDLLLRQIQSLMSIWRCPTRRNHSRCVLL